MEILSISDVEDDIKYNLKLNFFNEELCKILKNTISVDPEYSKSIIREIKITEEGNLHFTYSTKAINLKPMKKSINSMLENLSLVLETIHLFGEDKQVN